ncbi:hypothetical protein PZ895_14550 [Mesorhizobium sp. YIM 152430]|uniref:hypothetical protein n=1 Tax=Mesorhizobium sp. YIM 152430 TaxID=3031761 RepID=UPI0023DCCF8D|nr:hypothetical protein [Mesorhizobium sp. YIM 152430]MDF1600979.1 hypothetical protein [Mesorhizobium sp. YIM 152430]
MKRIIGLTTAALMGASMMVAPALAQTSVGGGATGGVNAETGVTGGVNAGDTVDDAAGAATDTMGETDAGTTAAIGADATFDGALSAIEGNATSTAAIDTMTEIGSVEVIRIGELEDADMTALETATTERAAEITELQAALEANTAVSAALEAEDVAANEVVAAQMGADGELVVYVE